MFSLHGASLFTAHITASTQFGGTFQQEVIDAECTVWPLQTENEQPVTTAHDLRDAIWVSWCYLFQKATYLKKRSNCKPIQSLSIMRSATYGSRDAYSAQLTSSAKQIFVIGQREYHSNRNYLRTYVNIGVSKRDNINRLNMERLE